MESFSAQRKPHANLAAKKKDNKQIKCRKQHVGYSLRVMAQTRCDSKNVGKYNLDHGDAS
jgi:hypothetical protein